MNLGKFLNENWITFLQVLGGLVVIGIALLLFGVDLGAAFIGFPVFTLIAGYFFKAMYVKKQV